MFYALYLFILLLSLSLEATNLKPWFDNDREVVLRAAFFFQNYPSIQNASRKCNQNGDDLFLNLSAEYSFKRYSGEFEALAASTRHQHYRFDSFKVTGRYQLLSEDLGRPATLTFGISLAEPYKRALHDVSSFHHGYFEAEATLSLGKRCERFFNDNFSCRYWGVFGFAIANNSYPWVRLDSAFETLFRKRHCFRLFFNSSLTTGKKSIDPCHFKGYGQLQQQAIDLGLRYGYSFCEYGTLSLQYARRVFAKNFPRKTNTFLLEYKLPFGLQVYTDY